MNTKKYLYLIVAALMFFAIVAGGCGGGGGGGSDSNFNQNQSQSQSQNNNDTSSGTWEVVDAMLKDFTNYEGFRMLKATPSVINFRALKGENGLYALVTTDENSERVELCITYSDTDMETYTDLSTSGEGSNEIAYSFERSSENIYSETSEYTDELGQRIISTVTVSFANNNQTMHWNISNEIYDTSQNKFEEVEDIYFLRVD